jgi:hypothetical protein
VSRAQAGWVVRIAEARATGRDDLTGPAAREAELLAVWYAGRRGGEGAPPCLRSPRAAGSRPSGRPAAVGTSAVRPLAGGRPARAVRRTRRGCGDCGGRRSYGRIRRVRAGRQGRIAIAAAPFALLLLVAAAPAADRASCEAPATGPNAVRADDWTRAWLRRAAAAGLVAAADPFAAWPLPERTLSTVLATAQRRIAEAGPGARLPAPLLAASDARRTRRCIARGLTARAQLELGGHGAWNRVAAGPAVPAADGYADPGPVRLRDRTGALVSAGASLALGAVTFDVHVADSAAPHAAQATLGLGVGPVVAWVGRRPLALGSGPRGSLVLYGSPAFDGAGIATPDGLRLPGPLRALGPVRVTQLVARMQRSGGFERPWFTATRVLLAPHDRVALGLQRAAVFGGTDNEPVTPRRVLLMALGLTDVGGKSTAFENQVASVDVFWRLPTALPLALVAEWGLEDAGFAFLHVPGARLGIELAAVPGAPPLGLGVDFVAMARSRRSYPPWYFHGALADGWTDRGRLLGHPLGGNGFESAISWHLAPPRAPLAAEGRVHARRRGRENRLAPDRAGWSAGAELRLDAVRGPLVLRAVGELERVPQRRWTGAFATSIGVVF